MSEDIQALYKIHILAHAKNPFHEGILEEYSLEIRAYNPMCGDQFDLYLQLKDEKVVDASFKGMGCVISKASTSVLVKHIIGKTKSEIGELVDLFLQIIDENSTVKPEELTDDLELLAFAAARQFPERKTCADLAWQQLKNL